MAKTVKANTPKANAPKAADAKSAEEVKAANAAEVTEATNAEASAEPGSTDDAGKADDDKKKSRSGARKKLKQYEIPADKLEACPDDFNPSEHKPLKAGDFKEEWMFLEYRASVLEKKAAGYRQKAELAKKLGSATDRAKMVKLAKMQEQMAKLRKELEASSEGINIDELLGKSDDDSDSDSSDE